MKKTIKLIVMTLLCIVGFSTTTSAQPPDSTDYLANIEYFFSGLDSNSITTKILIDRAPSDLDQDRFTGAVSSDTSNADSWGQLYFDLYNAKYASVNMIKYDSIIKISSSYLDQGIYPIAILNYDYNYVDSMAAFNGNIVPDTINNKLVEVVSSSSNYNTARAFAISFTRAYSRSSVISFIFPSSLYFKNVSGTYTFEADFGNGEGFNPIVLDSVYTISYTDTGEFYKLIQLKATNDSNVYFSKTGFIRKAGVDPPNLTLVKADFIDPSFSCSLISGHGVGNAKAYIQFADPSNPVITKPFIFVEGFDYDNDQTDNRFGDISWETFVTGKSFDESGATVYPQLAKLPNLIASLKSKGYDVIVLDFQDATTYIQKNANALIKLIQWVNANKVGNEENVIAGASMGGLIVRYALAYMENNNCNHCCKMMISFDSPHRGANIPLGILHFLKYYQIHQKKAWEKYQVVSYPAVLQMAVAHSNPAYSSVHSAWVTEYANLGYPKTTLNTAIVNGNANGTGLGFTAGDKILNYYKYGNHSTNNISSIDMWSTVQSPSSPPYNYLFKTKLPKGRTLNKKKWNVGTHTFLSFLTAESWFYYKYSYEANIPTLAWDNAPGSFSNFIDETYHAIKGSLKYSEMTSISKPSGDFNSFISTVSALDVNTTNLSMDFAPPSTNINLSPFFDPFIQVITNEAHIEITDGSSNASRNNIDWLEAKLDLVEHQLTSALPNANGNTYNFGEEKRNRLPAIPINNLGVLQINGNYNTSYGSGPSAITGSTFEVITANCDPTITINNGGKIVIGDVSATPDNIGILRLRKGSTLIIENNGTLEIQNGSKLIVEYGAKLVYKSGAIIKLNGANAILEIKGELEIQSGATFTFSSSSGVTNGFVRFDYTDHAGHQPITVTGTTANISLSGANVQGLFQDKVLEVIGGELTTPDNSLGATSYLNSFSIYNGMVNLENGAKLSPTVTSSFTYTYFNGEGSSGSEEGLNITKPAITTINHCSFTNLFRGIVFYMNSHPSAFPISYSSFTNNGIGIYTTDGGGLDVSNSAFNSNQYGIRSFALAQNCEFENCSFGSNSTAGIELNSLSTINAYFYHSSFTDNPSGIDALNASSNNVNVTIKCSKFKNNDVGVEAGLNLNLSPNKTFGGYSGGDNVFYYNSSASNNSVALNPTYSLYLDAGGNSFINSSGSSTNDMFIIGTVISCTPNPCDFYNTATKLKAAGNYWNPAPSLNNLNNGSGTLYSIQTTVGTNLLLDGSILLSFTSTCFSIPSGTEPQFVSTSTGPFNKTGDVIPQDETLEESTKAVAFSVFPNPATESVYVQTSTQEQKEYILQLFDLMGRKVYGRVLPSSNYAILEVSTGSLASGTYLITISTTDGSVFESRRIVISHE